MKKKEFSAEEKKKALEKFEEFLFNMDDVLEEFISDAEKIGVKLDFSLESLDLLEEYILDNRSNNNPLLIDFAAEYLGEVVRQNYGGEWQLSLDIKTNSLHYNQPVILGHTKYDIEFPPFIILNNFLVSKEKGTLKTAVLNDLD